LSEEPVLKNSPVIKIIIAAIAAMFDPLDLINRVIVVFKIFLKQLLLHRIYWSGQLPSEG
jgi:hypothetical protein